jgi:hypothetical protein
MIGAPVIMDQIGAFAALLIAVNAPPLPGQYKILPSAETRIGAVLPSVEKAVDDQVTVPLVAFTSYKRRGELTACHKQEQIIKGYAKKGLGETGSREDLPQSTTSRKVSRSELQ